MINFLLAGINPVAFQIGALEVRWYGIILTSAMVIGLLLLIPMGKKKGFTSDDILELFLWLIILAVVFARFIYVLANNKQYHYFPINSWDDFVKAIAIWNGGITIYGGILGGILGGVIWCKRKKTDPAVVLDMCIPLLLLGQAIGRWGNFVNQEAFGQMITDPSYEFFPFAVYIDRAGYVEGWYQATFFYESIVNFAGAIITYLIWRKNKVDGILVPFYLVWYCTIRLILDFYREDGLRVTKIACCIVIPICAVGGVIYYFWRRARNNHKAVEKEVNDMLSKDF